MINTNPELATDEDIQAFCSMALQDDFFIYSNTDTNNPEVILLFLCVQCTNVSLQTYAGPFRSALVVRTFAAHFSAIHGAIKVPELGDANSPDTYPCGGLALSAAAVSFLLQR